MDTHKEGFLRNEFFTLTVNGALGRSKTYLKAASPGAKALFRKRLREESKNISRGYTSIVQDQEHLSNIKELSDRLSEEFSDCFNAGRFRIGIAQKALNLYLKYLWCTDLIPMPPHCPFDATIIHFIPECHGVSWTALDTLQDYDRLVDAARKIAHEKPLAQWELELWTGSVQSAARLRNKNDQQLPREQAGERTRSMSDWSISVSKFHGGLKRAMKAYQGKDLKTAQINEIVKGDLDLSHDPQFNQRPDHCINCTKQRCM